MLDLKALVRAWYRGQDRFEIANPKDQIFSPYDMATALLEDMVQRNVKPFRVTTIDLSVAGELTVNASGFHVVIYGHDGTPNKAVNSTAYVEMWWEKKEQVQGFPMKHARGYSGVFRTLVLSWPAQSGVYADLVIHNEIHTPWIDGESAT